MKKHRDECWEIKLPDDWEVESGDGFTELFQASGSGSLQISASRQDDFITDDDLLELASDHLEAGAEPEEVELGDFDGILLRYDSEGEYLCEWYVKADDVLLFITYSCPLQDEGVEDDTVDVILDTLGLPG